MSTDTRYRFTVVGLQECVAALQRVERACTCAMIARTVGRDEAERVITMAEDLAKEVAVTTPRPYTEVVSEYYGLLSELVTAGFQLPDDEEAMRRAVDGERRFGT